VIAVYCGKAVESWLAPEWVGLVGVITGGFLAFLGNFLTQRFVLKRTAEIENQKIRASIIGPQVLVEIYSFLDNEAKYLQDLRLCDSSKIPEGIAGHRLELSKIRSLIQMLSSTKIDKDFSELIAVKDELEAIIVHNDNADKQVILDRGVKLIADIKAELIVEIIGPTQPPR
jgi:hypothetical protein